MLRRLRAAALAALVLSLAACATPNRKAEYRAFAGGNYAAARAGYEEHLLEGGAETTLDLNLAGTAALLQGDTAAAHRYFRDAYDDLEDLSATQGETVAATVGPERTKRWKGDPYERVMNA